MKKLLILSAAAALLAACAPKESPLTASGLDPEQFTGTYEGAATAL